MTDFLVTCTWADNVDRDANTKQFVAMTVPNPDDDAAEDFFDALQEASTASLLGYSVRRAGEIAAISAAAASPYSVKDKAILAFKGVTGAEKVRVSIPVPKNAIFTDDERVDVEHAGIAALIAWIEANGKTISGIDLKFTGGWRNR